LIMSFVPKKVPSTASPAQNLRAFSSKQFMLHPFINIVERFSGHSRIDFSFFPKLPKKLAKSPQRPQKKAGRNPHATQACLFPLGQNIS
jgi:hypothetical protein